MSAVLKSPPSPVVSGSSVGAQVLPEGVRFRLWAPKSSTVSLRIEGEQKPRPMRSNAGFHELKVSSAGPGTLYTFELGNGRTIPDPFSRFLPQDVHGPSEVIDPGSYSWRTSAWRGRPWEEAVLYELHIGTFSPEGTFAGAIEKLDRLTEIGITAIELMPVADFPGKRNWGYDGVQLFAPDSAYGRPDDLKALIDAAHERGLMVLLDVVYNHFGPDGNFLPECGPIFTAKHQTPGGPAVNYESGGSDIVREIIRENALYWVQEFNFDGLRLDAVHAIKDDSQKHILDEVAEYVRSSIGDRHVHLIVENDLNTASRLRRNSEGQPIHYTAQWNDDVHHLLHTASSGELKEFYPEFADDTEKLGRTLAEGFAFQGEWTTYNRRQRGEPSAYLPPTAFISFIQNHDQIGNRPFGERYANLAPPAAARAVIALLLLSPQIPLLFMGEEWAASTPFLFFCDFRGDLGEAVRKGRKEEFGRYPDFQDPAKRDSIPDPTEVDAFNASKLDWSELGRTPHRQWRSFYQRLLNVRHSEIIPRLRNMAGNSGCYDILGDQAVHVRWDLGDGSQLAFLTNLTANALEAPLPAIGREIWVEGSLTEKGLAPWTVAFGILDKGSRSE